MTEFLGRIAPTVGDSAAYCYRLSIALSVGHVRERGKMAELIEVMFDDSGGPKEPYFRCG